MHSECPETFTNTFVRAISKACHLLTTIGFVRLDRGILSEVVDQPERLIPKSILLKLLE
ncbi:MAG: hypothetical protein ACJ74Z_22350 [Bryobacteraceae bacterium]